MVKNLSTEKTQFLHLAAKYKKSNLKAFSKLELHIPTKDLVASRVAQYISVIRYLWYSREQYDDESFRKIIDWETVLPPTSSLQLC